LRRAGVPLYPVSAVTGEGLPLLLEAVWKMLVEHRVAMDKAQGARGAEPNPAE